MQTLTIKDLSRATELDAKALSAVRGGTLGYWKLPSYDYDAPSVTTTTSSLAISQANTLMQGNATGNGSAVFCGSVAAFNNQQASNSIV